MTHTVTAPSPPAPERARLFAPDAHEPHGRTLEDAVLTALRELRSRGTTPCLVCGSALDVEGTCADCGAELS
jgi:hypothetical protein